MKKLRDVYLWGHPLTIHSTELQLKWRPCSKRREMHILKSSSSYYQCTVCYVVCTVHLLVWVTKQYTVIARDLYREMQVNLYV